MTLRYKSSWRDRVQQSFSNVATLIFWQFPFPFWSMWESNFQTKCFAMLHCLEIFIEIFKEVSICPFSLTLPDSGVYYREQWTDIRKGRKSMSFNNRKRITRRHHNFIWKVPEYIFKVRITLSIGREVLDWCQTSIFENSKSFGWICIYMEYLFRHFKNVF